MSAKTAKTGVLVDIPIFELLSEKLVNGRAAVGESKDRVATRRLAKARAERFTECRTRDLIWRERSFQTLPRMQEIWGLFGFLSRNCTGFQGISKMGGSKG